jgi:hypothetical protein
LSGKIHSKQQARSSAANPGQPLSSLSASSFGPAQSINSPSRRFSLRDVHVRSRKQFCSSGHARHNVAVRSFVFLPQLGMAAQLGVPPDLEPQLAASQVRYYFACGSKSVSLGTLGR